MKRCEYFKDLILTDYMDGELDKNTVGNLEGHLLDCSDCRAFFKEVKNNVAMPFKQLGPLQVPAELWTTVRQSIEGESQVHNPLAGFIDSLKGWMVFPRMVPVFASLMVMLLAGSATLNTVQIQQAKATEQGEYLVSVLGSTGPQAVESNNLGTPIERYFL